MAPQAQYMKSLANLYSTIRLDMSHLNAAETLSIPSSRSRVSTVGGFIQCQYGIKISTATRATVQWYWFLAARVKNLTTAQVVRYRHNVVTGFMWKVRWKQYALKARAVAA